MEEYRRMKNEYTKLSEKYEKSQRELTAAKVVNVCTYLYVIRFAKQFLAHYC